MGGPVLPRPCAGQSTISAKASRKAADQAALISWNVSSSASIRRDIVTLSASASINARSSGIPTLRLERRVESIDSNTAFLRNYLPDGLLERHYEMKGWLFEDVTVLVPISGAQIRSGTFWTRRDGPYQRERR